MWVTLFKKGIKKTPMGTCNMTLSTECKSGHNSLTWGCKDCEQKLDAFIEIVSSRWVKK